MADGNTFQQLFWAVITARYSQAFVPVRPQGALGDTGYDSNEFLQAVRDKSMKPVIHPKSNGAAVSQCTPGAG